MHRDYVLKADFFVILLLSKKIYVTMCLINFKRITLNGVNNTNR